MRRLGVVLSLLLAGSVLSIGQAQKQIAFAKGVKEPREISLSDVARSVRYVALETRPESLLDKDILNATLTKDYLFVCDYKNLLQFTPDGKFIRQIGRAGQGPGEYNESILCVAYDEAGEEILITDYRAGKVLVYSFDGKFVREIRTPRGSMTPCVDRSGNLYTTTNDYLRSKDKTGKELFVSDKAGKPLYDFGFRYQEGKEYPRLMFSVAILYPFLDAIYYKNPLETTIYRLEGGSRIPAYELDLSAYEKLMTEDDAVLAFDKKAGTGTNLPNRVAEEKVYFHALFETARHMGIDYSQKEERCFAWYDKASGAICRVRSPKADRDGFTDDLENGYPVFPSFCKGDQAISVIPAATLLEKSDPTTAKGSLKEILANLQEEDNQVLQIVSLR